jgi:hypothetical protein
VMCSGFFLIHDLTLLLIVCHFLKNANEAGVHFYCGMGTGG